MRNYLPVCEFVKRPKDRKTMKAATFGSLKRGAMDDPNVQMLKIKQDIKMSRLLRRLLFEEPRIGRKFPDGKKHSICFGTSPQVLDLYRIKRDQNLHIELQYQFNRCTTKRNMLHSMNRSN